MKSININGNITITVNGNINYYEAIKPVSDAKDTILKILYNKRFNEGWGGYKGWNEMLNLYYDNNYKALYNRISQFKNCIGARNKVLECLKTLIYKDGI